MAGCVFVPLFLFVFFIIMFGTIVSGIGLFGVCFFFSFLICLSAVSLSAYTDATDFGT